jgi:hypothetical protein
MRKAYSAKWLAGVALALGALIGGASGCSDTDERPASWAYISATIIQPNCATSRCHSEGANVAGLKLDTIQSGYDALVGYAQGDNPDDSTLMVRLNGGYRNMDGSFHEVQRMPIDEPLPQADIDLVRKWIAAGAPNN